MLELLLNGITALGSAEIENVLTSAAESAIKNYKDAQSWKNIMVGTGHFFVENENDESSFFSDLAIVLSKENMAQIAKDLKKEDGYKLKHRLYDSLMKLMHKYEIPYEAAESYTIRIIYAVLEQLRTVEPDKYEHYFLQDWREEQEKCFNELQTRLDKMTGELVAYKQNEIAILSSGQMDIKLRRSTIPSLGIDFFVVDDEHFQDEFEEKCDDDVIFVRGRCIEETIYCILNELWRLNEKRPIYVVRSMDSWIKLQSLETANNIYIPDFYSNEIVAIDNNTNIFVLNENTPAYTRDVLEMRPRTRTTISNCLRNAGMEQEKITALLADTHGLYIPMKKHLFKGEYLKQPEWTDKVSKKAQKTGLLVGQWEECEGDKLIIEQLYGDTYEKFIEEVLPYTIGEDPFLYVIKRNGAVAYYLASTENTWSCIDASVTEPIWEKFEAAVLEVLNESENLFTYDYKQKVLAQFNGERLFWSETIRKGMLKTLIMKGTYRREEDTQIVLNNIACNILEYVQTEKQWSYISAFWPELCEIAPEVILNRLEDEEKNATGLVAVFENQTSDFLFGRNAYINILWGIEQFLVQQDYFWRAFRWLSKFDRRDIDYKSNSTKDIFNKVLCPWYNFSILNTAEDKIKAAEIALEISPDKVWDYIYSTTDSAGRSILGALCTPKYRDCVHDRSTTMAELAKTNQGYLELLLKHMEFSANRWEKIIKTAENLNEKTWGKVIEQLLYEVKQMSDEEVIAIKDSVRDVIYRHRYFSSSSWAMSDEKIDKYESLLSEIHTKSPEYEYRYLFIQKGNRPLLHPVPYDTDGSEEQNKLATQKLIEEKINEFYSAGYNLQMLAKLCAGESYSPLGKYLARYWKNGKWDYKTFIVLLSAQETGQMAIDYMANVLASNPSMYPKLIEQIASEGVPDEIIAKIYRAEAVETTNIPLVANASEDIKKIFWETPIWVNELNAKWALTESKKYSILDNYLDLLHRIHYQHALSAQEIFDYLDGIEKMSHSQGNQMTGYHIEQLLAVIQDAYIDDPEKCFKIAQIEILFVNLIEWNHMRCFNHMIKQSPELIAQLMTVIFKHDHQTDDHETNETVIHNMYTIYEKAHFCPSEENGEVAEDKLEEWIVQFRKILEQNDQASLFTSALGRLFSFSPEGSDGHEPCEAVRVMIEKYGDDKMISRYQTCVYNRRGVFSPSAGKEELEMANAFKANAAFLEPNYPKTAKIFYGLADTYRREAERERRDAENGWY